MFIFNYQKYKDWRKERDCLTEEDLEMLDRFSSLSLEDKKNRNDIKSHIILKEWCDYEED